MKKKSAKKKSLKKEEPQETPDLSSFFEDLKGLMVEHNISGQLHSLALKPLRRQACVCNPPCTGGKKCVKVYNPDNPNEFECQCR